MINSPDKRHEFVFLFDATNSNPNGDPDAGNLPRIDPETLHGLVTDVALKRKVRDYLQLTQEIPMFIQSKVALNDLIAQAGEVAGVKESKAANESVQQEMCRRYYDIRMFGAVLSTGKLNGGQVRGPVQLTFAKSVDSVLPLDISISRQARAKEDDSMGLGPRKSIVPYGLYRASGFFNPFLAKTTGVSQGDLDNLWSSLSDLFEFDRSAARNQVIVRGLFVFSHDSDKGNAPSHKLLELIKVQKKEVVEAPRSIEDYEVAAPPEGPLADFPGVTLTRLV